LVLSTILSRARQLLSWSHHTRTPKESF